jgi:hypothetical protein
MEPFGQKGEVWAQDSSQQLLVRHDLATDARARFERTDSKFSW